MTLTQLRYLVAIADAELNITLAAARVHATQPGLSKQLKQLEDELGFLLFVRKGRSLDAVTPAGEEVIKRARRVLAEANNIRTYAANQRRESQGQLVLTTTHTQARFVLPPAVAQIKQRYRQVSVHLQQAAGVPLPEAVVRSAITRAQPILLTALAAMLGAFFILDDPIFNGLAIALIFGILVSTVLTLVVIPLLYFAAYHRSGEANQPAQGV